MVHGDSAILITTAATLAVLHTAVGVDHSVPFVVIGHTRGWSLRRTLGVTALCGLGHVGASVLIGAIGIALGVVAERLEWIDTTRGDLAAWLLLAMGVTYACWAMVRNRRGRRHNHAHAHADGTIHTHPHDHQGVHLHPHDSRGRRAMPWALFVVFLLGPCEALLPLMMAANLLDGWLTLLVLVAVFAVLTVATMLVVVAMGLLGLQAAGSRLAGLDRHLDVLAGGAIAASGAAILLLEL